MGGKAIESLVEMTTRLDKDAYQKISQYISNVFNKSSLFKSYCIIPSYRNKQDFGDLDVLVFCPNDYSDAVLASKFNTKKWQKNGNVTSFAVPISMIGLEENCYFQIDVIKASNEQEFSFSSHYFAYNDLGNLIGRVAHAMGLRFGHKGLYYVLKDDTYQVAQIQLTDNIDEAFVFLGYDPVVFHQGFDALEDVFRFATSSPFYHPSYYLLENRNHTARTRDRKRTSYMEFLDFIKNAPISQPPVDEHYAFNALIQFNVYDIYQTEMKALHIRRAVKSVFNGKIVSSITGLEKTELGQLMIFIKENSDDNFWLTCRNPKQAIISFYQQFIGK